LINCPNALLLCSPFQNHLLFRQFPFSPLVIAAGARHHAIVRMIPAATGPRQYVFDRRTLFRFKNEVSADSTMGAAVILALREEGPKPDGLVHALGEP
jgi:hypothetical protein